jgi:hypothetical protein
MVSKLCLVSILLMMMNEESDWINGKGNVRPNDFISTLSPQWLRQSGSKIRKVKALCFEQEQCDSAVACHEGICPHYRYSILVSRTVP